VAVHIDVEAFRESIPPDVDQAANRLLEGDAIGEIEPSGGGVQAPVRAAGDVFRPWVGIVDGAVAGRCTCPGMGGDLCAHAAAVMLAAVADGINFSSAATPPDAEPGATEHATYVEAVRRLTHGELAALVVRNASRDGQLGTELLSEAGMDMPA
jgi:SWIM zinc finger